MIQVTVQNKTNGRPAASMSSRVVDLCCGMGGWSVAARDMGMRVVAGVDVNPRRIFADMIAELLPEAKAQGW